MVSLQEQQAEPMARRNGNRLVGQAIRPLEDPRLISGQGEYLEDLRIPDMVDVALVRSIEPHARITSIDASAALAMPGVIAVITGDDLKDIGSVPVGGNVKVPAHPPLARDIVRFVGDPIAAVVADSRYRAQDAADAVVVTYENLPAVSEARQALAEDAPLVHEEFGSNITLEAKSRRETSRLSSRPPIIALPFMSAMAGSRRCRWRLGAASAPTMRKLTSTRSG